MNPHFQQIPQLVTEICTLSPQAIFRLHPFSKQWLMTWGRDVDTTGPLLVDFHVADAWISSQAYEGHYTPSACGRDVSCLTLTRFIGRIHSSAPAKLSN